jgi:hypothetical protein
MNKSLNCLLNLDGNDLPCQIENRPSLWVEEIHQLDGSIIPGEHYWDILTAKFYNKQDVFLDSLVTAFLSILDNNGKIIEKWTLKNTRAVSNGFSIAIAFDGVFYETL